MFVNPTNLKAVILCLPSLNVNVPLFSTNLIGGKSSGVTSPESSFFAKSNVCGENRMSIHNYIDNIYKLLYSH